MAFPFNAQIDGQIVEKYGSKTFLDAGGRPGTTVVDLEGNVYRRHPDNDHLFVPSGEEPRVEVTELQPSHEPQNVSVNGGDSPPGEGDATPAAPLAADANALGTDVAEVEAMAAAQAGQHTGDEVDAELAAEDAGSAVYDPTDDPALD